jgi:hypothetical protein
MRGLDSRLRGNDDGFLILLFNPSCPRFLVGHPFVVKMDSRLRGNDGRVFEIGSAVREGFIQLSVLFSRRRLRRAAASEGGTGLKKNPDTEDNSDWPAEISCP